MMGILVAEILSITVRWKKTGYFRPNENKNNYIINLLVVVWQNLVRLSIYS